MKGLIWEKSTKNKIFPHLYSYLKIKNIKESGLYKEERIIESPQNSSIIVNNNSVLNFCSNNYLGLSNHPKVINSALEGSKKWGFGLSSVRFICGTQTIHKTLEGTVSTSCSSHPRKTRGWSDSIERDLEWLIGLAGDKDLLLANLYVSKWREVF